VADAHAKADLAPGRSKLSLLGGFTVAKKKAAKKKVAKKVAKKATKKVAKKK